MTTRRMIHVHPSRGDDLDGDGTVDAPFQTWQRAATVRSPEDVICYDNFVALDIDHLIDDELEADGNACPIPDDEDEPVRTGPVIVIAAGMCSLVIGFITSSPWYALACGVAIAAICVWLDTKENP